jgi:hypothetical protein
MAPILGIWASSKATTAADTGAMFPLQVITVGSAGAASIDFTNIPGTYTHLQIRGIVRSSLASSTAGFIMRANSDSASNYSAHNLGGDGSGTQANAYVSNTYMYPGPAMPAASATASVFGTMIIDILDYANTNKYKVMRALSGFDANGSGQIYLNSATWRNTNAITSLSLLFTSSNCVQYSQFALYGILGA